MTKALEKEIEEMEEEEVVEEVIEEVQEEVTQEDAAEEVEEDKEEVQPEEPKEDEEAEKKRAEYRKRIEERKAKQQTDTKEFDNTSQTYTQNDDITDEDVKAFVKQKKEEEKRRQYEVAFERALETGQREFQTYEKEYKEVFKEYEDDKTIAYNFLVKNAQSQGLTEEQAKREVDKQMVLVADKAVREGRDPVEVVHEEAKKVRQVIESYAEELGYKKTSSKTKLQAVREVSKANAMTGGAGRGAKAVKTGYNDLESDEVAGLTIGQMMQMSKQGEL